jgi:hypothetical protein
MKQDYEHSLMRGSSPAQSLYAMNSELFRRKRMLEDSESLEQRIRERAFALWMEAGCPERRADEFWQLAREKEMEVPARDMVEEAGGHYPPTGDTQNFA